MFRVTLPSATIINRVGKIRRIIINIVRVLKSKAHPSPPRLIQVFWEYPPGCRNVGICVGKRLFLAQSMDKDKRVLHHMCVSLVAVRLLGRFMVIQLES